MSRRYGNPAISSYVIDAAGNYVSTNVEAALAEIYNRFSDADNVYLDQLGTPTYRSVQDKVDVTQSAGKFTADVITAHAPADGTIDVAAGSGFIKTTDDEIGDTLFFDWEAQEGVALTNLDTNYIFVDYNIVTGAITIQVETNRDNIDGHTEFTLGRVWRDGNDVHIVNSGSQLQEHSRKNHERLLAVRGFEQAEGGTIAGVGTRELSSTAGIFFLGSNRITTPAYNTTPAGGDTFDYWYRDGGGGWTHTTGNTQIDNINYDNNAGAPQALTANRYGVFWVYICLEGRIQVLYGQGDYTLANAEDASPPASIPEMLSEFCILAAKIVIQKAAVAFTSIVSAYITYFPTTNPANHNDLGALQGGVAGEYYHLTSAEHVELNAWLPQVTLGADGSAIFNGLVTADGVNPEADLVDDLGTALLTWRNIFVQNWYDAAGNQILGTDGAGNIDTLANLSCNIVFTGAQTVDGVDISAISLSNMPAAASGNIDCGTQAITNVGNVDGVDVSALATTVGGLVSDAAYAAGWNADTTHAASKNAIYDQLVTHYANTDEHHTQSHTIVSHSDATLGAPGADRIVFWDETASKFTFLVANTGLSILGTNLNCDITQYTDADTLAHIVGQNPLTLTNGLTIGGALAGVTTLSMNNQLTNSLAIGTPPFVITSTTVVPNLNVDQVDGHDMDQDVLQASSPTFVGLTLSGAIATPTTIITSSTITAGSSIISKHVDSLKRDVTGSRLGLYSSPTWNDGTAIALYDDATGMIVWYDGVAQWTVSSTGVGTLVGALQIGGNLTGVADLTMTGAIATITNLTMSGDIISANALNFKVSGDADDYIQFVTAGDIPRITSVGASMELNVPTGTEMFFMVNAGEIAAIDANGLILGNANARIDEFSTDGTLGGNSDVAVPTEQAVKTYVDAQILTTDTLAEVLAIGNESDGTDMILDEGSDLIVYSDDKVTEKARIDGATGNITTAGTVDGVDISAISLSNMPAAASGNIDAGGQAITNVGNVDGVDISAWLDQSVKQAASPTFVGLTLSGAIATITNLTMSGDIISANALNFKVSGDADDYIQFVTAGDIPRITSVGASMELNVPTGTEMFFMVNAGEIAAIDANGLILGNANARIDEFSTDGTLGGNSDVAVPTEQAVKTYVDAQILTTDTLAEVLAIGNESDGTDMILDEGSDLIVYSDDKVTEKARIDGATGNITTAGTVDGVDISAISLSNMPAAASGNIDAGGQAITNVGNVDGVDISAWLDQSVKQAASPTFVGLTLSGAIATITNLTMSGDIISANALNFKISGDNDDYIQFVTAEGIPRITSVGASMELNVPTGEEMFFMVNASEIAAIDANGLILGNANARINEFSTDGTMAGNSDTAVPTEAAVVTYDAAQIASHVTLKHAYAPEWPHFLSWVGTNGATLAFWYPAAMVMPASDNDCRIYFSLKVPDTWTGDAILKILYTVRNTTAYSVLWSIASEKEGEVWSAWDLLNNSAAYDFAAPDIAYELTILEIDNLGVNAGDVLGAKISSDALNSNDLLIYDIWIEET